MPDESTVQEMMKDLIVEEAEVDAYMDEDNAGKEKPSNEDWKNYLLFRYREIKEQYKAYMVAKREAELGKKTEWVAQSRQGFMDNYKSRKIVVRELRKLGEKIEDPFIQG